MFVPFLVHGALPILGSHSLEDLLSVVQNAADVRFTPESGHSRVRATCLLCAKSRHCEQAPVLFFSLLTGALSVRQLVTTILNGLRRYIGSRDECELPVGRWKPVGASERAQVQS
jgi:hypothetical protein